MKRKDYSEPAMRVVKLQHRTQLLQASVRSVSAQRSGYGTATEDEWD